MSVVGQSPDAVPTAGSYPRCGRRPVGKEKRQLLAAAAQAHDAARHLQLLPEDADPGLGTAISVMVAGSYAWLGEKELAIAEVIRLLDSPAVGITGEDLRTNVLFAPLRGDPRIEALASDPRYDAPIF